MVFPFLPNRVLGGGGRQDTVHLAGLTQPSPANSGVATTSNSKMGGAMVVNSDAVELVAIMLLRELLLLAEG